MFLFVILQKIKPMRYSIITINYNNKEGLRRTIESVIGQTFTDFEYIIIDGGSTDGSVNIIKENARNITFWVSEPDKGIYHAMNKGTNHATGDYLIFMNSGDCFHSPTALSEACDYTEDIICGKILRGSSTIPCGHHKSTITMVDLIRDTLPHQAMFIKKDLLVKHPYDEKYRIYSDGKFAIESIIFDNCTFRNIDAIFADYDINGISASSNKKWKEEKNKVLAEFLPPRIIADYNRLAPVDEELLDQAIALTKTVAARKLVKEISKIILWLTNKKK